MHGQLRRTHLGRAAALTALIVAASCTTGPGIETTADPDAPPSTTSTSVATTIPYVSEVYADPAHWLCLPDRADDACDTDLDVTRIDRDGTRTVEPFRPADDPPIDCFYVYPTVSTEPTPNSGLVPTDAERRTVQAQAARLRAACRLYAPMYRQVTRAALFGDVDGVPDRGLAFDDVADAWAHYLANDNEGRGVVLIGHSQGAGHLRELLRQRIDPSPSERELVVSAILLGTTVRTPVDAETGADFDHLPPCRRSDQVGCIVSFSTYAADAPPGDAGYFGGVRDTEDAQAICTNPAALGGGAAPLDSIMFANPLRETDVTTPFVRYVGLAEGGCVEAGTFHYLEVRYTSEPDDAWPAELGGRLSPPWGLHLIDANVAQGDLVSLVADQAQAFEAGRAP